LLPTAFGEKLDSVFMLPDPTRPIKDARQLSLDSRLQRHGVLAQATVTGVVQSKPRIIFRFKQVITYRYTDHLGGGHEGKSGHLSPGEAAGWLERQWARRLRKPKP
jgi:hypothetical protein